MGEREIIRIDGIKWWITTNGQNIRIPVPLCPIHNLRLDPIPTQHFNSVQRRYYNDSDDTAVSLECAEESHRLSIPRNYGKEKNYIINRVDALAFSKMDVINLDDESIPVAIQNLKKDSPYWIRAKLTESKPGVRLIVWAGDRSNKNKTQLFVEPALKRMTFDQNDDHPTEIFTKVEALFSGGIKAAITAAKKS